MRGLSPYFHGAKIYIFHQGSSHLTERIKILLLGDGYGLSNGDSFTYGNFYASPTSSGSIMSSPNLNPVKLTTMSKTSSLISSHSNLHGVQQAAHPKSQAMNQLEKLNFQSSLTSGDGSSHPEQHYQQQPQPFQQPEHYAQQQFQHKVQGQHPHHFVNRDAFSKSQLGPNLERQVKSEPVEHKEVSNSQVPEQFQLSEMQSQFQQDSTVECSRNAQQLSFPTGQNDLSSTAPRKSQQMLNQHKFTSESGNNFNCLSGGTQSESGPLSQWNSQSQDANHESGNMLHEQHLQSDFRQRITQQNDAQCNNLSSDGSIIGQTVASRGSAEPLDSGGAIKKAHRNQQRWLLFLLHARRCPAPEGRCQERYCQSAQKLCRHIEGCDLTNCPYPRCHHTRLLLRHFKNCKDPSCPVCVFVRNYRRALKLTPQIQPGPNSVLQDAANGSCKSFNTEIPSPRLIPKPLPVTETSQDLQPSLKRMKIEPCAQSLIPADDKSALSVSTNSHSLFSKSAQCQDYPHGETSMLVNSELKEVKEEIPKHLVPENLGEGNISNVDSRKPAEEPVSCDDPTALARPENIKTEKETGQDMPISQAPPSENAAGTKSGKPKIKGVSLIELFTPEQVREHITGLRQWVGQVSAFVILHFYLLEKNTIKRCRVCCPL